MQHAGISLAYSEWQSDSTEAGFQMLAQTRLHVAARSQLRSRIGPASCKQRPLPMMLFAADFLFGCVTARAQDGASDGKITQCSLLTIIVQLCSGLASACMYQ